MPIQQAEIIVEKLKEAGVEAKLVVKPGAGHGWGGMDKDIASLRRLVRRPPQETGRLKAKAAVIPSLQAKDHVGETPDRRDDDPGEQGRRQRARNITSTPSRVSATRRTSPSSSAYDHADKFKAAGIENPADHFKGKTIRVTGHHHPGEPAGPHPVEDPAQIKAGRVIRLMHGR